MGTDSASVRMPITNRHICLFVPVSRPLGVPPNRSGAARRSWWPAWSKRPGRAVGTPEMCPGDRQAPCVMAVEPRCAGLYVLARPRLELGTPRFSVIHARTTRVATCAPKTSWCDAASWPDPWSRPHLVGDMHRSHAAIRGHCCGPAGHQTKGPRGRGHPVRVDRTRETRPHQSRRARPDRRPRRDEALRQVASRWALRRAHARSRRSCS